MTPARPASRPTRTAGPGFKYNLTAAGDTLYGWRAVHAARHLPGVHQPGASSASSRSVERELAPARVARACAATSASTTSTATTRSSAASRTARTSAPTARASRRDNRTNFFIYTLDAGAHGDARASPTTSSRRRPPACSSTATCSTATARRARTLPPGATTVTAGAIEDADETTSESRTLGGYIEQNLAFRDRLFLTGAVRSDRNSAFGADFKTVFYPKLAASWVVSDESFFPTAELAEPAAPAHARTAPPACSRARPTPCSTTRRRTARRRERRRRRPSCSARSATATSSRSGRPSSSSASTARSADSRVTTEVTYYNKSSKDALISRIAAAVARHRRDRRASRTSARCSNAGWEVLVNAQLIAARRVRLGHHAQRLDEQQQAREPRRRAADHRHDARSSARAIRSTAGGRAR